MSMRSCAGLTYQQIWEAYRHEVYPHVSDNEKLQIHNKWKRLADQVKAAKSLK